MTSPRSNDVHGGLDVAELARLGLRPDQAIDFSANLNPFAPSPAVLDAARRAAIDRYPDRTCRELREELARIHDVSPDAILVGNGSSEILWLLAIASVRPGDPVAILGPTFSGYERAVRLASAEVIAIDAIAEDFRPPWEAFANTVAVRKPKLAFVANPNNPTGQDVASSQIERLADDYPETLVVLDEAYADEAGPTNVRRNLLRVRSLTKAHGLAGLRLGYAIGEETVIARLGDVQPPWSVNAVVQAAGLVAVRDRDSLRRTLSRWREIHARFVADLRHAGFAPAPSRTTFFLLPVGDAAEVRERLLARGLVVRDCSSFGLPGHIRISSRTEEENARLLADLILTRNEFESMTR